MRFADAGKPRPDEPRCQANPINSHACLPAVYITGKVHQTSSLIYPGQFMIDLQGFLTLLDLKYAERQEESVAKLINPVTEVSTAVVQ